jgi:prepilin-type N-terminal cleavage/methylation domain-containing protein
MRHGSRSEAGFTLIEVLIALTLTVLLMGVASELMVSMRRSSDRMRLSAEARRTAQQAADYLAMHVRGASDTNATLGNPAAILVWYQRNGAAVQATWNNVSNPALADVGTDIITVARPDTLIRSRCLDWPGSANTAANARWQFGMGCPDGQTNLDLFKDLTGYDPDTGIGEPVLIVDSLGQYSFYQVTRYLDAWNVGQGCSQTPPELHLVANPGLSNMLNPPGGQPALVQPIHMMLGVRFYSFRVRNGWLEQKEGIFDPATDSPGTSFVPVLPNVEDVQLAWIFNDGQVWNTAAQQLPSGTYPNSVPSQGTGDAYDVINVVGLRVSVVSRSGEELSMDLDARFHRPAVEDRTGGAPDRFFHHRVTTLAMVRNRNLRR